MTNIFEYASLNKQRFNTPKGPLSAEQLWDLPLSSTVNTTNLNSIAVELDKEIAAAGENKRIASAKPSAKVLNKLAIVEHIMAYKQEVAKAAKEAAANKEKKAVIVNKIAEMEIADLTDGKSLKQLKKAAAKL